MEPWLIALIVAFVVLDLAVTLFVLRRIARRKRQRESRLPDLGV